MKYIKYISILLFTLFRKVFGLLWSLVVLPSGRLRAYSRNVVYNYKLQNGLWLKRLYERDIEFNENTQYWSIKNTSKNLKGVIKKREVSKLEYLLVYWFIWGWIDDDSNYDTMSLGYLESFQTGGEREGHWIYKVLGKLIDNDVEILKLSKEGNAFDIGDERGYSPLFRLVGSLLWVVRNTAYNFKYDQYETVDTNDIFLFTIRGKKFGWEPEDIVENKQNYTLKFWEE